MKADVVIAVRGGPSAKSRCGGAFGREGCAALVQAMLADMLKAVARTPSVRSVHVVTPTKAIAELAGAMGAAVIAESAPHGLNVAFDQARRHVADRQHDATLALLPGDLPLLHPSELEQVLGAHSDGTVVVVPAKSGGGTGAIVLRADVTLPLSFGLGSFDRHLAAVRGLAMLPRVVSAPSVSFDLDWPSDATAVLKRAHGGRTGLLLRRLSRKEAAA